MTEGGTRAVSTLIGCLALVAAPTPAEAREKLDLDIDPPRPAAFMGVEVVVDAIDARPNSNPEDLEFAYTAGEDGSVAITLFMGVPIPYWRSVPMRLERPLATIAEDIVVWSARAQGIYAQRGPELPGRVRGSTARLVVRLHAFRCKEPGDEDGKCQGDLELQLFSPEGASLWTGRVAQETRNPDDSDRIVSYQELGVEMVNAVRGRLAVDRVADLLPAPAASTGPTLKLLRTGGAGGPAFVVVGESATRLCLLGADDQVHALAFRDLRDFKRASVRIPGAAPGDRIVVPAADTLTAGRLLVEKTSYALVQTMEGHVLVETVTPGLTRLRVPGPNAGCEEPGVGRAPGWLQLRARKGRVLERSALLSEFGAWSAPWSEKLYVVPVGEQASLTIPELVELTEDTKLRARWSTMRRPYLRKQRDARVAALVGLGIGLSGVGMTAALVSAPLDAVQREGVFLIPFAIAAHTIGWIMMPTALGNLAKADARLRRIDGSNLAILRDPSTVWHAVDAWNRRMAGE